MLAVYVDDFKMSGKPDNLKEGWKLIGKHIKLETPSPLGRYLGCQHISYSGKIPREFNPSGSNPSLPTLLSNPHAAPKLAKRSFDPKPISQGGRVTDMI